MAHFRQRLGIRITRGWAALLVLALAIGLGALWLGPLRAPPPQLELLAIAGEQALPDVMVRGVVDPDQDGLRFPLQLAVRNAGMQRRQAQQVALHVPGRYRLVTQRGRLSGEVVPGVPLRRYVLDIAAPPFEPGAPPRPLPGLETIWLEPDLPRYYCTAQDDVPEFIPAPHYDAETLSDVRIFYSMHSGAQRSTGLLRVRVDPLQIAVTPAAMPPPFPTVLEEPEAQVPELGMLRYGGTRTTWCGDPEQPLELYVVQWLAGTGGRFYVIYVQGQPRKHLYDLNGDGVIELETWDVNGDGRFEARRQARYAVPEFLLPLRDREAELLLADTLPRDSAWLALFRDAAAGPLRFTRPPVRPPQIAAAPGEVPGDLTDADALEPLPPPDSAWLALFLDADAGPLRFSRGRRPAAVEPAATPAAADAREPGEPGAPGAPPGVPWAWPAPTATPAQQDTVREDTVRPPPPRRRVPIGTPVPTRPPGGGMDPP
jgi:hypothetical protein